MNQKQQTLELRGERELVMTRHFAAPPQLVWQAYTNCAHLSHWWGPAGWELTHCTLDLRVGGIWHYCMSGEMDGNKMDSWGRAEYQEIDAPNRLVYTDAFSDEDGNIAEGMPQMVITITLDEAEGGTLLTSITELESAEARQTLIEMGVETGITQTWDRLDNYLPQL